MGRRYAFVQLILARVREFYREPEAVFWVYGFPLILAIGLGTAFASSAPEPASVDVQGVAGDKRAESLLAALKEKDIKVSLESPTTAMERFKNGKTSLVIVPEDGKLRYYYDPARSDSILAKHWIDAVLVRHFAGTQILPFAGAQILPTADEIVSERGNRYIDFLLPGLIGMNIMGGGLFGVGFVLVDMRVRKLFKRLIATPMHRGDFLLSLL